MAARRRIERSEQALATLADIYAYSKERWGTAQAKKYAAQIDAAFTQLAASPGIGHRHPDIPEPYLVYAVESHIVVYRTTARLLYVTAIFHMSMHIGKRMEALLEKMSFH